MKSNQSTKEYRIYEELGVGITRRVDPYTKGVPYSGNGQNIKIPVWDASITFDGVLRMPDGKLIVIEAKCLTRPGSVSQEVVFGFQKRIECLRLTQSCDVEGVLFTSTGYQLGALKFATRFGIRMLCAEAGQVANCSVVRFVTWNPILKKKEWSGQTNLSGVIEGVGTLSGTMRYSDADESLPNN